MHLYDQSRYAEAIIYGEMDTNAPATNRAWLRVRSAQILGELGRHKEAAMLGSPAMVSRKMFKGRAYYSPKHVNTFRASWFPHSSCAYRSA